MKRRWKRRTTEDPNIVLARAAKKGDQNALNQLLIQNEPAIYKLARRYLGRGLVLDELVQLGREGYWKSLETYDETRGSSVNTMGLYGASRYINDEFRRMKTKMRSAYMASFERSRLRDDQGHARDRQDFDDCLSLRRPNSEQIMLMRELIFRVRQTIKTRLTDRERFVLCRYFGFDDREGPWTFERIADAIGTSRANAPLICQRALKKLRMTSDRFRCIANAQSVFDASIS